MSCMFLSISLKKGIFKFADKNNKYLRGGFMSKDENKDKKKYIKPKITKYELDLDEVVMAKCKTGNIGFVGPTTSTCKKAGSNCKDLASA